MIKTRAQWWIAAALIVAFLMVMVVITHNVFTARHPGQNDFMSRWEGARSYWVDGLNPYGEEASLNIQERIYGRAVIEDEDPGYFAYPFYTVFLVWPLVYTSYAWASAVWMVLLEVCLVVSLFLMFDLFRWRPKPWLLGVLIGWTLFFYFAARGLLLGQPGVVVYLLEVLTIWALVKERDGLAGAALAISTLKPQMGFLIVPFLLLWGLSQRRWRFITVFSGVFGGLMLASFVLQPSWLGDWIAQLQLYPSYTALGSPVWIVMTHYLGLGSAGEWIVAIPLYLFMLWGWFSVIVQKREERLLWVITLTLTVTHLAAPRTATPHYVLFILPLIFYFTLLDRKRRGGLWIGLILLALLVLPWIHFLLTVDSKFEHPTVYLPLPFTMLILLWVTRRQWWAFGAGEQKRSGEVTKGGA